MKQERRSDPQSRDTLESQGIFSQTNEGTARIVFDKRSVKQRLIDFGIGLAIGVWLVAMWHVWGWFIRLHCQ